MMRRVVAQLASAALSLGALTACLPTNNFITPTMSTNTVGGAGDGLDGTSSGDGAQPPCTQYDTSNPNRAICVSCYNSILATRCPGQSSFSTCLDSTVVSGYVNLVNQCILQSVESGFVCTTTCSGGLVINPTTCTCTQPTPTSTGSGITNVDVGQKDFGPPIVQATYPPVATIGTPSPLPLAAATPCEGTLPIYLGVQNRGDTVFRLNSYGQPSYPTPIPTDALGHPYFTEVVTPFALTTDEVAQAPGANAMTWISFETAGGLEITGASAPTGESRAGPIVTVSTGYTSPTFVARDQDGNVYVSDTGDNTVSVICNNPTGVSGYSGNSPYCIGAGVGSKNPLAGQSGHPGYGGDGNAYTDPSVLLNQPHGIVVDNLYDVFIADSGNHVIRIISSGNINTLEGSQSSPGNSIFEFNYPYGIDLDGNKDVYFTDYLNHNIRMCLYLGSSWDGSCSLVAGNGSAGFSNDGTTATAAEMNYPSDVKANWNGNLVYADSHNDLVRAVCNVNGKGDFCDKNPNSWTTPYVMTLAGQAPSATPRPNDTGDGTTATKSYITYPYQIALAKQGADDGGASPFASPNPVAAFTGFRDNNIVFTERLLAQNAPNYNPAPLAIPSPANANIVQISMGTGHICLLNSAGNVYCLGNNNDNQMGGASTANPQVVPIAVPSVNVPNDGLRDGAYGTIGSGSNHTCALSGGDAPFKCWGDNADGQLGFGQNSPIPGATPITTAPSGPSSPAWVPQVVGGDEHTCAIEASSYDCAIDPVNTAAPWTCRYTIWCWGDNSKGQLGTGASDNNAQHAYPAVNVDLSSLPTDADTRENSGQYLDDPENNADGAVNVQLAAGSNHTCIAYSSNGDPVSHLSCWGDNTYGQLGTGDTTQLNAPGGTNISVGGTTTPADEWAIAAGGNHTCAWAHDGGTLYCWGDDTDGQVGNGATSSSGQATPVAVPGVTVIDDGWADANEYYPIPSNKVALGLNHTCAITNAGSSAASGTVMCWGDNTYGQLGNDEIKQSLLPTQVIGLPTGTIIGVWAGGNQTCALIDPSGVGISGIPYCWGDDTLGQIGVHQLSQNASGNVVRIICGNNSAYNAISNPGALSLGFCSGGVPAVDSTTGVGPIFTLAGVSGQVGNDGAGDDGNAKGATFAHLAGITYDGYKNLVVSSGSFTNALSQVNTDDSLRLVSNAVVGSTNTLKYSFEDSNTETSYYCLRLKPVTWCDSSGACSCEMAPPTDESDPDFWESVGKNVVCPL